MAPPMGPTGVVRRYPAVVALVAWTFFVWTTRIGNIWNDGDLDTAGMVGRTALALSFTALALLVVVALVKRAGWLRRAVDALAVWTVAVWLVRVPTILVDDHETAFKVVHTVLALVSIGLVALAERSVRGTVGAAPERVAA